MTHAIAKCISSCGSLLFFRDFFLYLTNELDVDQCSIFLIDRSHAISCLVTRNFLKADIAVPLADAYLQEGYKHDPNITLLKTMSAGQTRSVHLSEYIQKISSSYQSRYFSNPGLGDKVSILAVRSDYGYYINLYRALGRRSFRDDGLFLDPEDENVISALVTKHYSLDSALVDANPIAMLSDREMQVCQGILHGKKTETIAFELGVAPSTIITYRRRAYQKLGINSRRALFALYKSA